MIQEWRGVAPAWGLEGGNSCVFGMRLPSGEPMTEGEEEKEKGEVEDWD